MEQCTDNGGLSCSRASRQQHHTVTKGIGNGLFLQGGVLHSALSFFPLNEAVNISKINCGTHSVEQNQFFGNIGLGTVVLGQIDHGLSVRIGHIQIPLPQELGNGLFHLLGFYTQQKSGAISQFILRETNMPVLNSVLG